ncbi:hypothetical protein MMC18_001644 [Xylographa bjoerkii]|nr:hypothetical protein [Xylographa bjoerkii]
MALLRVIEAVEEVQRGEHQHRIVALLEQHDLALVAHQARHFHTEHLLRTVKEGQMELLDRSGLRGADAMGTYETVVLVRPADAIVLAAMIGGDARVKAVLLGLVNPDEACSAWYGRAPGGVDSGDVGCMYCCLLWKVMGSVSAEVG